MQGGRGSDGGVKTSNERGRAHSSRSREGEGGEAADLATRKNIPDSRKEGSARGRRELVAPHRTARFERAELNFVTNIRRRRLLRALGCSLTDASCANMYVWFTLLAGLAALSLPFVRKLFPYLGEDCTYILRSIKFGGRLNLYKRLKHFYSIVDQFLEAVRRHPDKTFVRFEGREYSYGEVDRRSNKVARALQTQARLKEGDSVALFLGNEPCFIWTWLALAKLGCPAALLNFNIRSKSLLHCFSCCGAKVIIASAGKMRCFPPSPSSLSSLGTFLTGPQVWRSVKETKRNIFSQFQ